MESGNTIILIVVIVHFIAGFGYLAYKLSKKSGDGDEPEDSTHY